MEIKDNGDGTWVAVLEGDVQIINTSPTQPLPDIPESWWKDVPSRNECLFFAVSIISETSTTLVFKDQTYTNEWRIILDPLNYQIFDPDHSDTSFAPQQPIDNQPKPVVSPDGAQSS